MQENSRQKRKKLKMRLGSTTSQIAASLALAGAGMLFACPSARAFNLYNGNDYGNNLEVNLQITLSYSGFYRVNDPSAVLAGPGNPNGNDGDANFRHGIVGNLIEAIPVLDLRDGDYGAHVSGEFFLNTPYLGTNRNNQPATVNPYSIAKNTDFTSATRNVNGENARLLTAFVYAQHTFADDQLISLKFGRQTLMWGSSLYFASDGIAGGMAPIDVIAALDEANPQARETYMPTGQAVVTYSPVHDLTFQGFYQFEWAPYSLQGVGAYFSSTDVLDKGGQRIIAAPDTYFFRTKDIRPPIDNGEFGASVQATVGSYDFGLYALRFDSKTPQVYTYLSGTVTPTPSSYSIGTYKLVYPRDIQLYGASFDTVWGAVNVAGEISGRRNQPLVSKGIVVLPGGNPGGASNDPLYAVGDTVDAQISETYVTSSLPLDPGGMTISGEAIWNHLIDVTENRAMLATGHQASAAAFDVEFEPSYYDVLPNLEVQFPVSITYDFLGRSLMDSSVYHGVGNFTAGVAATYQANWVASLTYKDYLGRPDPTANGLADRGYISLNLQHTF